MPAKKDPQQKIIDAALDLAAAEPWRQITLVDIARHATIDMVTLYGQFSSKADILRAWVRDIDRQVLAGLNDDDFTESRRDRLFDIIMARFDALAPRKAALRSILHDRGDLALTDASGSVKTMMTSMRWMLEASGFETGGLRGSLRIVGISAVYARCFRQWLKDDSPDLGPTMSALDRELIRGRLWDKRLTRGTEKLENLGKKIRANCCKFPQKPATGTQNTHNEATGRPVETAG
ncbi:TetR family transcriptional regulator [Thalassospira sp.]|uniref:TetR family transcriptional regulator n=1 Tax=Thalassospira sp. TaxID=1912094 RepID=UPI002732F448|nr:TetR family transcriptional regulator [Thalassospira sp.]MDP2697208.1 TetR family transcriptional regulator [Thalassospira sp.]